MGPDDGCHEVPDPIAPIDMMLESLDPTRMPMSFPLITTNGPMFIFVPPISIPGMGAIGLADGLAEGIGMFICVWGEAKGVGEADGLCIPGISLFISGLGDAEGVGEVAGICIFGMSFVFSGEAAGEGVGDGVGLAFAVECPGCCADA